MLHGNGSGAGATPTRYLRPANPERNMTFDGDLESELVASSYRAILEQAGPYGS